jgi:hypothetical protein
VNFSNTAGFSVTEQPLRIASDGTVVVAVPLYIDPVSHATASGSVSVSLTQGNQSTAPVGITIQDIPTVSSYGTKLGEISHAFLVYEAMLIARRINELQAYQVLPGNTVDTSQAQASLRSLLQAVINARRDVDYVSASNGLVLKGGTFSNGLPIQFDQNSLDLMDRIIGLHLSQMAPAVLSNQTNVSSARRGRAISHTSANLETLLNLIDATTNQVSYQQAISDYYHKNPTAVDKALAVANGAVATYGQLTLGTPNPALVLAGNILGTTVSAASLLNNFVMEGSDLVRIMFSSNQDVINNARDDLYDRANDSKYAFTNYTLSSVMILFPESSVVKALALVSAVTQCIEKSCYSSVFDTSIQAAAETNTVLSSNTQGFALVNGSAQIPFSTAMPVVQDEIQLSSNGVAFNALADENGNYQLFVPLQADPFDYAGPDLQIVDPTDQSTVNTIDLHSYPRQYLL